MVPSVVLSASNASFLTASFSASRTRTTCALQAAGGPPERAEGRAKWGEQTAVELVGSKLHKHAPPRQIVARSRGRDASLSNATGLAPSLSQCCSRPQRLPPMPGKTRARCALGSAMEWISRRKRRRD
eukprot:9471795-Pyramimonas_sp.AAC.1